MLHGTNKRSTQKRINLISIDLLARYLSKSVFFLINIIYRHNASLSDLSSIVLSLNKSRKTEIKTQLIFELVRNLIMPYLHDYLTQHRYY